jgi:hypothetical protein
MFSAASNTINNVSQSSSITSGSSSSTNKSVKTPDAMWVAFVLGLFPKRNTPW